MKNCSRELNNFRVADRFLRYTLCINETEKIEKYSKEIAQAEMLQNNIVGKDTLVSIDYRSHDYSTDEQRGNLRKNIYNELISKQRPENDDEISIGIGGALPRTGVKKEKQAYYVIGLPASGKSEVSNMLSDKYGAIILDSDFAKRKFPEYDTDFGASVIHEESSLIVFGSSQYPNEECILEYAIKNNINIVIPKIGDKTEKVLQLSQSLIANGYDVHLILVRLDRSKATLRALKRYIDTHRYVPLSLIFDEYGNNPTITFYDLKQFFEDFKSFTMISSDVPYGDSKEILVQTEFSPQFDYIVKNKKEN